MGFGRPDLVAKIHLLQLPLYLVLVYFLISQMGIIGAAIAFTLRVTLEFNSFIFCIVETDSCNAEYSLVT